jgi:hypothetical protein
VVNIFRGREALLRRRGDILPRYPGFEIIVRVDCNEIAMFKTCFTLEVFNLKSLNSARGCNCLAMCELGHSQSQCSNWFLRSSFSAERRQKCFSKGRLLPFSSNVPQHHGRHRDNASTWVGISDGDAQIRGEEGKAHKSSMFDLPEAQICLPVVSTESSLYQITFPLAMPS